MKIEAYKTNIGLFINRSYNPHCNFKLNGVEISIPQGAWLHLKDIHSIDSLQVLKPGENLQTGFILKISSVANEEIPLELSMEQVGQYWDDEEGEFVWTNYDDYKALYKPVYVKTEPKWEDQPFELSIIREIHIENYENPAEMKLSCQMRTSVPNSYNVTNILAHVVKYDDIERILTPEFLLHERPCHLTSGQVYSIIRYHVLANIDGNVARVTSDYDFCFTVKRRIAIKPVQTKKEVKKQNGRSYATPRFTHSTTTHKEVEIFQMAPKAYQSYTVIQGWQANSLKEMAEQVKHYLDMLMEEINRPVAECEHCGGTGHLELKTVGTNERNL